MAHGHQVELIAAMVEATRGADNIPQRLVESGFTAEQVIANHLEVARILFAEVGRDSWMQAAQEVERQQCQS